MDQTFKTIVFVFKMLLVFKMLYNLLFSNSQLLFPVRSELSELQHERYALPVYTCRYTHHKTTRLASENTRFYSHPSGKQ